MNRDFSLKPVLVHADPRDPKFLHQFYVAYHGTAASNVESILANGLRESEKGMFGKGVYVSRDIRKTFWYTEDKKDGKGPGACFKLLVYTGKTKTMTEVDNLGSWRSEFDSAYLPPNNDVVKSKREETCLRSAKQVRILGIAYGFDSKWSGKVRDLTGTGDNLDVAEWQVAEGVWKVEGQRCQTIEIVRRGDPLGLPVCIVDGDYILILNIK